MRVEETRIERPIGREREIDQILEEVVTHGACYLTGPAGIGKSTLLREVRRRLEEGDIGVISISGMEATALVPLAPLLRLCPPGADDAGAAIIAELYRRSRNADMVVVVDDVHLLDGATAAIVRQIAGADIIGLVVAHRDGEPVPPAVASIREEGLARVVDLAPLDTAAVGEITERILGTTEPGTVEWIWERGRGNPLYTRELIIAAAQTGALEESDGRWRAFDAPLWTSRLHSLLARRLAGVTPEERACLQLVAVGGQVHLDILSQMSDLATVFELEKRNLIRLEGQLAELDHPLYRTAILATMSELQIQQASLRIAEALEGSEKHRDPVVIASLRLDAGEEVDEDLLWSALQAARDGRLPERAERFSRELLAKGEDAEAHLYLCEALGIQRRWEEAESEFESMLEEAAPEEHPRLLERWAYLNFEFRVDLAISRAIIEDAISRIGDAGSASWQLLLLRLQMFTGNLDESVQANQKMLMRTEGTPLEPLVRVTLATACSHSGDFVLGVETFDAFDFAPDFDSVERARIEGVILHSQAWLYGYPATAGSLEETLQRELASGDPEREALARLYNGIVFNDFTCTVDALSHFRGLAAMERYARRRRVASLHLGEMARAAAGLEDGASEARELLQRLFQYPAEALWASAPLGRLAEAMLAYRAGEDPIPIIHQGLEHARKRSARIHEVPLVRFLAGVGNPSEVTDRLSELARHMGGGLAELVSREVQGLADSDPDQLDAVAVDAWRFGALGLASDAAAWAVGFHSDRGNLRSALTAQLRSDAIVAGQPVWTVARDQLNRVVSEREQQVVEAVASGASNRAVAENLFISHRTVESHLRRLYRRFGLDGREELSDLVRTAISAPQPQERSST
jgi:DNA-binding CsgD family transcriptional regulator